MVSVLAISEVDLEFDPRAGQTEDYTIGICCFSAKHAASRNKSKDWLARNQHNVSKWSDMYIRGLLFQWASTIKIQRLYCCQPVTIYIWSDFNRFVDIAEFVNHQFNFLFIPIIYPTPANHYAINAVYIPVQNNNARLLVGRKMSKQLLGGGRPDSPTPR